MREAFWYGVVVGVLATGLLGSLFYVFAVNVR